MKKMMKLSKILLLIITVFSYIASPIAVLAEEIVNMPLDIQLETIDNDQDGYVDNYKITYKSVNSDYEEDKNYNIKFDTTFTYNNEEEVIKSKTETVSGSILNSEESNYMLEPISKYFDGIYKLEVSVYDENEEQVYSNSYEYNYSTLKGLTGKLNDVEPTSEEVGVTTVGNYNVINEGTYTQLLNVLTGELSPNAKYRIVLDEELYSETMTGEEIRNYTITGTITDLIGKLAGEYNYIDTVIIEEVEKNADNGEDTVVNEYIYSYNSTIKYGTNNDDIFSQRFGITFEDGYMIMPAKKYLDTEDVITIGEINSLLKTEESGVALEVIDNEGNILDLDNEEVLNSEVKNDYVINFTSGATASYKVVITADINNDNEFTKEDILPTIEKYILEEDSLSMDVYDATDTEEFGKITFEDLMELNENLKEEDLDEFYENKDLNLLFGEIPSEIYVGDTFELDVLINLDDIADEEVIVGDEENVEADINAEVNNGEEMPEEIIQYIDGIDALASTLGNVKLTDVKFNDGLIGTYNDEGRVVGVGATLVNEDVVLTLVFTTIKEGFDTIEFSGNIASYLNIREFETITKELNVLRKFSSNNNLSSLTASIGTFDTSFDKDVTIYTLTVPYNTERVVLSGSLEDIYSEVDGLIEYELTEDKTTAIITVTAEDGSTKVYTVYIIKEEDPVVTTPIVYYYSSNNYLKSLEIEGYDIDFDKYTNEYKINVKNGITSLDIIALAEDSNARVEITGNSDFKTGENTVIITVTAENGNVREYKLIVNIDEKKLATDIDSSSNNAEKIVIIILIILVVLGLLYLIFKKDEEVNEEKNINSKGESVKDKNVNTSNKNINSKKKK